MGLFSSILKVTKGLGINAEQTINLIRSGSGKPPFEFPKAPTLPTQASSTAVAATTEEKEKEGSNGTEWEYT